MVALALLVPWWIALADWANGISGYLGIPGVGSSAFAWIALTAVAGVLVAIGLPSHVRRREVRMILGGAFAVLVLAMAIPSLVAGLRDGISTAGVVVGAISALQVALILIGIRLDRQPPR